MRLTLRRMAVRPGYTIGKLYIDNKYFCDTLEDSSFICKNLTFDGGRPAQRAGWTEITADTIMKEDIEFYNKEWEEWENECKSST